MQEQVNAESREHQIHQQGEGDREQDSRVHQMMIPPRFTIFHHKSFAFFPQNTRINLMAKITAVLSLAILLLGFAGCASAPKQSNDPRQAAENFYSILQKNRVSGLPQGRAWRELRPLVSDELAVDIRAAQKQQRNMMRKHPDDKPPWIEGDLFSSLFEGFQTFTAGVPRVVGNRAEVVMRFTYTSGGQTTRWSDLVILRKTSRGWLVENVRYLGKWAFAPRGTLIEVLTAEGC
jgi:hypothetical protein